MKKLLAILLAAIMLVSLTACKQGPDVPGEETKETTKADETKNDETKNA